MESEKVDSLTAEQVTLLRRLVTDPTLVSDGSLRATIASQLGWEIDAIYFTDTDKPWGIGYTGRAFGEQLAALEFTERVEQLEERVDSICAHLVL